MDKCCARIQFLMRAQWNFGFPPSAMMGKIFSAFDNAKTQQRAAMYNTVQQILHGVLRKFEPARLTRALELIHILQTC